MNRNVLSCIRLRAVCGGLGDASRGPLGVALGIAIVIAGCATPPSSPRPAHVVSPPLELVAAGTLELPDGCEPDGGAIYRTRFLVRADGRVADARSESGTGCVQQALEHWFATFRYRPPREAESTVVDWMSVTARRM